MVFMGSNVVSGIYPSLPMSYSLLGTSFRLLSVEERENLSSIEKDAQSFLDSFKSSCGVSEAALVSTCNRFEIVTVHERALKTGLDLRKQFIGEINKRVGKKINEESFYGYDDREAVRHLFRVAASMDSMVVGEAQILGQIKQSYQQAVDRGSVGRYLHHLFQFTLSLAKKVRANTNISDKGVSVSYIAVRLAQQIFGDLASSSVLVVGSGQMAELAVLHLKSYGCKEIIVANRTLDRAFDLANKVGGSAVTLSEITPMLSRVDLVITSLSNIDKPLIEVATLKKLSRGRPLFLVDLAVPRNLNPALAEVDDVFLYNIDDLSAIVDENKALREAAASEAELLIEFGLLQFDKWLTKISAEPAILDFRAKVFSACEKELKELLLQKFSHDVVEEKLAELSHKISQNISHDITRLLARLPEGKIDQQSLMPLLFEEYLKVL
jgi:glutamyl-tRNA reductase